MVYFTCNCSNVIIATENVYGPLTNSELKSRNDLPIYNRYSDPTADTYSPFGNANNILEATLGIGGIKIEHSSLTQCHQVNSLTVVKCYICSTYTHAAKSSDSVRVFINDKLRRATSLEVPDALCPLKISLSRAVQPNAAYLGKSAAQLQRLMAMNAKQKDKAAAIDELVKKTAEYNEEAQRLVEDEIRMFTEKAHEKYKAKQSAVVSCMDVLAQLIASMDSLSDESNNDERPQENGNRNKSHDSNNVDSTAKVTQDDMMSNLQVDINIDETRSPVTTAPVGSSVYMNGLKNDTIENVTDTLGEMEFNGDDDYAELIGNDDSGSSNADDDVNDEDVTVSESQELYNDSFVIRGNRQSLANDISYMPNRRGSSSNAYSRSVPIDVPTPSFGRRNSRLLEISDETLDNIDEDYYTKISRDAKTVVADGTEILGQLPTPNPRSLANHAS